MNCLIRSLNTVSWITGDMEIKITMKSIAKTSLENIDTLKIVNES